MGDLRSVSRLADQDDPWALAGLKGAPLSPSWSMGCTSTTIRSSGSFRASGRDVVELLDVWDERAAIREYGENVDDHIRPELAGSRANSARSG